MDGDSQIPSSPFNVLLVEDNPADAKMLRLSLKDAGSRAQVVWLTNGEDAISYIRCEKTYGNGPLPQLAILDLCMPRRDGFEVLSAIKERSELKDIPIVILTTSYHADDVRMAEDYGQVIFITKPKDLVGYEQLAIRLVQLEMDTLAALS